MGKSIFWAKLLGLYTVILSAWTFVNIKNLHALFTSLSNNPPLVMTLGVFTLLLGLSIVFMHSIWKGWPILVTLVGYWISIKGLALLFFPQWIQSMLTVLNDKNMIFAPIPSLVIGLILLFFGFFGRKHA